jgi:hypothetical protein
MQNLLEEAVGEVFEHLRTMEAGFCSCAQCHDDVLTHALNKARPRYSSGSLIGSAVTRVALTQEQARAEIAVLVLEAMRRVQRNPRHGPEGYVGLEGIMR